MLRATALTLARSVRCSTLLLSQGRSPAAAQPAPPTATCPVTTEEETGAMARAWHEAVIHRRKPQVRHDILAPEVVHHAAGGAAEILDEGGVRAMMGDFLAAFPDLHDAFDLVVAPDAAVVERDTATGIQQGQLGELPPSGRSATWTGITIVRIAGGKIVEVWAEVEALSRTRSLPSPRDHPGSRDVRAWRSMGSFLQKQRGGLGHAGVMVEIHSACGHSCGSRSRPGWCGGWCVHTRRKTASAQPADRTAAAAPPPAPPGPGREWSPRPPPPSPPDARAGYDTGRDGWVRPLWRR